MKFRTAVLLASALSVVGSANAAVNVEFSTGVESMFVNGDKKLNLLESTENVTLNNGLNQVVVRVSKLIEGQGQLEKYRSVPIVMTFEANDQTVMIEPAMRLINAVDQINFDANPSMRLVTKSGNAVKAKIDALPKDTSGDSSMIFGRDFQKELAMYNRAQGYVIAAPKAESVPEPKTYQLIGASKKTSSTLASAKQPVVADGNAMILIQADFLRLSEAQRQIFLNWAQQQ